MIEPEMAFADLKDDMLLAEGMLKYIIRYVLENAPEEMAFFNQFVDKGLIERLEHVANSDFGHVTYTEAVDILMKNNDAFDYKVFWGCDRQTVCGLLVPGIGEIIGGSQREDKLELLEQRMEELGLKKEDYDFYLDLRRYGSVRHAGFGLGFERCVMYLTGMGNIRDVVPFPRTVKNCEL